MMRHLISIKKHFACIIFLLAVFCIAAGPFIPCIYANDLAITNVELTGQNTENKTAEVEFDISWENSWRNHRNHDAVWLFVKYSTDNGVTWAHATIKHGDSSETNPSDFTRGSGSVVDIVVPSDGKGVFIRRSASGAGKISVVDMKVVWNWDEDGLSKDNSVRVKVYGIEMTYVPAGTFSLGDPNGTLGPTSCFYSYGSGGVFTVSSENAISVGTSSGYLYYDADTSASGDRQGPIPASFPKGYDAFYVMKYEITQAQYRDFLNTLSYAQQVNRIAAHESGTFMYSDGSQTDPQDRNGIMCQTAPSDPNAGIYVSNLNNNETTGGDDDGEWIACNYISWADLAAYSDWAAIRPMTELEFEKSARGSDSAVQSEYAWGNATLESASTSLSSPGTKDEVPDQGNCNYISASPDGPFRAGAFADGQSSREEAGAGYYGAMELSGNMREYCVSVGATEGRGFTGLNGDGVLSESGDANVTGWPGTAAAGTALRGGSWNESDALSMVADRTYGMANEPLRQRTNGGRLVRKAF